MNGSAAPARIASTPAAAASAGQAAAAGRTRLPVKSFARKMVALRGHGRQDAIVEIASIDRVSLAVAGERYDAALAQRQQQRKGQILRRLRQRSALDGMRWHVLSLCEAATRSTSTALWSSGRGLVSINDKLLMELATEWTRATRARREPDLDWVREQAIEALHYDGLIVRGTDGMRITQAGADFIKANSQTADPEPAGAADAAAS